MGTQYSLPILYTIIGAAAFVMCAYAVARLTGNFNQNEPAGFSNEQLDYMREVRERNFNYLRWMMRGSKQPPPVSLPVVSTRGSVAIYNSTDESQ